MPLCDRRIRFAQRSEAQAGKLFHFGRGDFLSLVEAQSALAQADAAHAAAQARLAG